MYKKLVLAIAAIAAALVMGCMTAPKTIPTENVASAPVTAPSPQSVDPCEGVDKIRMSQRMYNEAVPAWVKTCQERGLTTEKCARVDDPKKVRGLLQLICGASEALLSDRCIEEYGLLCLIESSGKQKFASEVKRGLQQ